MHQLFSHREGLFHKDLCEILHAGAEIIHNPHPGLCLIYVFFDASSLLDFLFEC